MSRKIEFEGEVSEYAYNRDARGWTKGVSKVTIIAEGRLWEIIPNAPYRVTLEPIEPELKPCPFCGGVARVSKNEFGARYPVALYQAMCNTCYASTSLEYKTRIKAIEAWNRRVTRGNEL